MGVVELVHGVHRADSAERRARREAFVEELLSTVAIDPLTADIARLASKLDAEQPSRGIVVPFADLLIGTTALSPGYSVQTVKRYTLLVLLVCCFPLSETNASGLGVGHATDEVTKAIP